MRVFRGTFLLVALALVGARTIILWLTFWPLYIIVEKLTYGDVFWPEIRRACVAEWRDFRIAMKGVR